MSDWLVKVPNPAARMRLYVLPYAGGNVAAFLPWAARLGPEIDLAVVNLPGRGLRLREPHPAALRPLVLQIAAAISADPGPQDFAIFGHSMGAVLALEVLRTCAMMHLRLPRAFIASGCRWPGLLERDDLHALPEPAFRDRLRKLGGTPPEVLAHEELMAMVSPALRADFALLHSYVYRPGLALPMPLHVFTGTEDPEVGEDHLEGWLKESRQPGGIHPFPGGHFFLHGDQEAAVLARLRAVLL